MEICEERKEENDEGYEMSVSPSREGKLEESYEDLGSTRTEDEGQPTPRGC